MPLTIILSFLLSVVVSELICRKYAGIFKHSRFNEIFFHIIKFALVFFIVFLILFLVFSDPSHFHSALRIAAAYLATDLIVISIVFLLFRKKYISKTSGKLSEPQRPEQVTLEILPDIEEKVRLLKSATETSGLLQKHPLESETVKGFYRKLVPGADHMVIVSDIHLNSRRRINKYLLECHEILPPGGVLIAPYQTADQLRPGIRKRSGIFWPFLVFFHEALPKVRYVNSLYFMLTKGSNRWVSKVELWGRLNYCGYEIIHEETSGNRHMLIARKVKTTSRVKNPSYYPFIRLERIALNRRIIRIHKVRTMYPFSEFLQKAVFEQNNLHSTGKIQSDYRITPAGRFLRKYWIDELPQVIDWLRSDIKLVGIRAMSRHFFSLYPNEYQDLFVRVKPGIISPLFEENDTGFSHIVETEKAYLESYLERPIGTDIRYFFIVFEQIFFKAVRSK